MNKTELHNLIFTEKYRPSSFDDLICKDKDLILNHIQSPASMPSYIFYSSSPGTGKTSLAKLMFEYLKCDTLMLNASKERGIDTIRDKINLFAQSLSSVDNIKRMIFMDEADGLTSQAQDCLKSPMEMYSDNCFFIFTCNNINKIIQPIQSRCILINFGRPNRQEIAKKLEDICNNEKIKYDIENIYKIIETYYPDIRAMILTIQNYKEQLNTKIDFFNEIYHNFFTAIQKKDIAYISDKVYSGELNINGFLKWFFRYLVDNYNKYELKNLVRITLNLAEIEKNIKQKADFKFRQSAKQQRNDPFKHRFNYLFRNSNKQQ